MQDGVSMMQTYHLLSDNPGREYPFLERSEPSYFRWFLIICYMPLSLYQGLSHFYARDWDRNCIKKHPVHMSGKL